MWTLIRADDTVQVRERLPVIALRDLVFFPYMVLPLLIGRPRSLAALHTAAEEDHLLLLLAQRSAEVEDPQHSELYRVGTVTRLLQVSHLPDGTARIVVEGLGRARVRRFLASKSAFRAVVGPYVRREVEAAGETDVEVEALVRRVQRMYEEYVRLDRRMPDELSGTLSGIGDHVRLGHLMAGHLLVAVPAKQAILEAHSTGELFGRLRDVLAREIEVLRIEERIEEEVREQAHRDPRQIYLPDQLKGIHREPGEEEEWAELEQAVTSARLPPPARERAVRELKRLKRLGPLTPEASVIRTYLDWILALPWEPRTEDNLNVRRAAEILEQDHYGLMEVKERILDYIAVLSLVGQLQGPILCLVGPPGVGKTSLGRSIAGTLGRAFVRMSLGGVRDEAEIRGHRRTYVGALPGRVIQGMRRSGSRNPVFLLDEVDKMARDVHGDPAAALLEVLDPEQNRAFQDHYLELEFDLSDVLFITTANTLGGIPAALRDRMEVIRLPGYLETEKRVIASRFLWPRQLQRHGLAGRAVVLEDETVQAVITEYTKEAGVRELERRVSRVARKLARRVAGGAVPADAALVVGPGDLRELLGPPLYPRSARPTEEDRVGIANALAWTASGGEVLDVEVAVVTGRGRLQLTGTMGSVMRESAFAAVTYARSRAAWLGLDREFHRSVDIHIHIPEGATPKDGPSAGVTMAIALISALTGIPTRPDAAMTGEITLRGRVLPVGGVREKAVAAQRGGMRRVILPAENAADLELLPEEVKGGIEFVCVRTMDEVLDAALLASPAGFAARRATEGGSAGSYAGGAGAPLPA
ncbi:MAG: endopeptidase La [Gemmatimonadetes bacterium]|nr:endopeptidase La [Gemmatimonadota bacterium]